MSSANRLLEVDDLSKTFASRRAVVEHLTRRRPAKLTAVDGISFTLHPQQAIGIVGESGSGKSTLAKCLVRLEEPDGGRLNFRSADVIAARGNELAAIRRRMQLVFQDPYSSLNPLMSVGQAVSEPAVVHGLARRGPAATRYAAEVLDMVGLPASVSSRRPRELSGGQRQRVAIARALAARPDMLIADEPVSALDVSIQAQILKLFEKLRSDMALGILLIAHQLGVVAHITDTVMVMYLGRVVEAGPTREVFQAPSHPYTVALLQSQPGRHRRGRARRPALEGEIPSPLDVPAGCRFRLRCPMAQEICKQVDPPPADVGAGHRSWCHFAEDVHASPSSRAGAGARASA